MASAPTGGSHDPQSTFDALIAVASNLRWTWHARARQLFSGLDPSAPPSALEWPVQLLLRLGVEETARRLASDPDLATVARGVISDFATYLNEGAQRTWFVTHHGEEKNLHVAYFAAEFALSDSLPIYAGGLGAVAGEHLKSASALGVPLVGIGLLYREASHQWIDDTGQHERWDELDPTALPITPILDSLGRLLLIEIPMPGRTVVARCFSAPVGRNRLLLLDTKCEQNHPSDQLITARLYSGDHRTRIKQEFVLGIGGVRLCQQLGLSPSVLHMNEGHAAFAALEKMAVVQEQMGVDFDTARAIVSPQLVFTTHTPVAAGHDYFAPDLAREYLATIAPRLGVDTETLARLGRYNPEEQSDTFCPTILAMRLSGWINGVSSLHGKVTRSQWAGLWPRLPVDEVPIGHVTNGVHLQSWISTEVDRLLDSQLGPTWRTTPMEESTWQKLAGVDPVALWKARCAARERLVEATRSRKAELQVRHGHAPTDQTALNKDALTIGFVGRFVAYKRPTMFLSDHDRLARLLSDPLRPVQIVFGGKAHHQDEHGKHLLDTVISFARERGLEDKVVFIEDFDMTTDRVLAQGADLWLNTPRRPLEACGIGGMKSGANGALNLSTLDGWWDEAWSGAELAGRSIGWSIGTRDDDLDHEAQDHLDTASLYDQLEFEIIPEFFDRDELGVPRRWMERVITSMSTLAPTWHSHRMVQQYTERAYLPGTTSSLALSADGGAGAVRAAEVRRRLESCWSSIDIELVSCDVENKTAHVTVTLADADPDELRVELWVNGEDDMTSVHSLTCTKITDGVAHYDASWSSATPTRHVVARVMADLTGVTPPLVPGLITWSD